MSIEYLDHLPERFRAQAAQLYLDSLKEKLLPVLGPEKKARQVVSESIFPDQCLAALYRENLVGIMGIQTKGAGFMSPDLKTMIKYYGISSGTLRLGGLSLLNHGAGENEVYVEGVAVAQEMRGKGIGSAMFHVLEKQALGMGIQTLSLEVVDTNPKARALYEKLGFVHKKTQAIWPLNHFVGFPFQSSTLMIKTIG